MTTITDEAFLDYVSKALCDSNEYYKYFNQLSLFLRSVYVVASDTSAS